jgi:uncharacterized protein (TIGR02118 family)
MEIFRSAIISRKPGVGEAEFTEHWIKIHGGLAYKLPGLGSYRQNHIKQRLFENLDTSVQAVDGISQLAFKTIKHMEVSDASPEYAAVKKDIPAFQGAITILVLQKMEIWGDSLSRGAIKLLWLSKKRAPDSDAKTEWSKQPHPRILGAKAFVQNFVVDRSHPVKAGVTSGDAAAIETLSELWFDDEETMTQAIESDAGKAMIFKDPILETMALYQINEIVIR